MTGEGAATSGTPAVFAGSQCDSLDYLDRLFAALELEAADEGLTRLDRAAAGPPGPSLPGQAEFFYGSLAAYRRARARVVGGLDASFEVAKAYWSMDEFWADSARQETGEALGAYWDSYENGRRRRLEARLASAFGATEAILLNTGMSALDVALRALPMRPGSVVLMHERAYFETTDLMEHVLRPDIQPVQVDMRDPNATWRALGEYQAAAIIVETALNGTSCDIPVLEPLLTSGVPVLIDNSALGHALGWDDLAAAAASEVIVAESATKYLTRSASAGVLYGSTGWVQEARLCARRVGQQLQGRALHHLRPGEIDHCRQRTLLHAARAGQFARQLRESGLDMQVTSAATAAAGRDDILARLVTAGASGCMMFVRLDGDRQTAEQRHRACVAGWAAECSSFPRVRAGFGWTETSGRAYGADPLNTKAGEAFIRISVGCEPREEVQRLSEIFCKHAARAIG
jgi:cystathionine beta-lyase/cystathionine gamma-synthase